MNDITIIYFKGMTYKKILTILQLIIGLQTNDSKDSFNIKEFFAYEAARELCVFL